MKYLFQGYLRFLFSLRFLWCFGWVVLSDCRITWIFPCTFFCIISTDHSKGFLLLQFTKPIVLFCIFMFIFFFFVYRAVLIIIMIFFFYYTLYFLIFYIYLIMQIQQPRFNLPASATIKRHPLTEYYTPG